MTAQKILFSFFFYKSGWVFEPLYRPSGGEMSLDVIKKLIGDKTLKTDWQERIDAMRSFTRQCSRWTDNNKFEKTIRKYAMFFTMQVSFVFF